MIKYFTPLAFVLLSVSGAANANLVKTSNQAVTACKSHINENVQGVRTAKLSKVRSSREQHIITFAVRSDDGNQRTICNISKEDGSIALNN